MGLTSSLSSNVCVAGNICLHVSHTVGLAAALQLLHSVSWVWHLKYAVAASRVLLLLHDTSRTASQAGQVQAAGPT